MEQSDSTIRHFSFDILHSKGEFFGDWNLGIICDLFFGAWNFLNSWTKLLVNPHGSLNTRQTNKLASRGGIVARPQKQADGESRKKEILNR